MKSISMADKNQIPHNVTTDMPVRSVNISVGTLITLSLSYIAILFLAFGFLYTLLDGRINDLDEKIDGVEARLNARMDGIETRIERMETRIIERLDKIEAKL